MTILDVGLPMSDRALPQSFWNATTNTLTDMSYSVVTTSHHHHYHPAAAHHTMHPASHHSFTSTQNMVNSGFPRFAPSTASAAAGSAAASGYSELYNQEAYHHATPLHHHSMHPASHHSFTSSQNMVNSGFPRFAPSTASAAAGSATATGYHHDLYTPEAYAHHAPPLHHHSMHVLLNF